MTTKSIAKKRFNFWIYESYLEEGGWCATSQIYQKKLVATIYLTDERTAEERSIADLAVDLGSKVTSPNLNNGGYDSALEMGVETSKKKMSNAIVDLVKFIQSKRISYRPGLDSLTFEAEGQDETDSERGHYHRWNKSYNTFRYMDEIESRLKTFAKVEPKRKKEAGK